MTWEIGFLEDGTGWFESNVDGTGGNLIFEGKTVIDYDGVFALPDEVVVKLKARGFKVPKSCCVNEELGDEE